MECIQENTYTHVMKRFAEKIKKARNTSCEYVPVQGTRHEIYCSKDVVMRDYIAQILNFFD